MLICQTNLALPYRLLLTLPTAVISNIMASNIFRHTKLGVAKQANPNYIMSAIEFFKGPTKKTSHLDEQFVTVSHNRAVVSGGVDESPESQV